MIITVSYTHLDVYKRQQSGSYVSADRLRFDFTHFEAVSLEELKKIEQEVNEVVLMGLPGEIKNMEIGEAKKNGAMALFGEKYSQVAVSYTHLDVYKRQV